MVPDGIRRLWSFVQDSWIIKIVLRAEVSSDGTADVSKSHKNGQLSQEDQNEAALIKIHSYDNSMPCYTIHSLLLFWFQTKKK